MLRARRSLMLAALAAPAVRAAPVAARAEPDYAAVTPRPLAFPRDHGAHPAYRIEWWYLTGWLDAQPQPLGFQITFFRSRTPVDPANPSRFAAHQLLIAHAALADPARGTLLHEQRIARAGFGVAADERDTDVRLDGWRFRRQADGATTPRSPAAVSSSRSTRPRRSRCCCRATPASRARDRAPSRRATITRSRISRCARAWCATAAARRSRGRAWLDHEWSSTLLDPDAAGWDWIGMNLDDGAALTAFQIRRKADAGALWAYAALRAPGSPTVQLFAPEAVRFEPLRDLALAAHRRDLSGRAAHSRGPRRFDTSRCCPTRSSMRAPVPAPCTGRARAACSKSGKPVGRGYLELTGYVAPLTL